MVHEPETNGTNGGVVRIGWGDKYVSIRGAVVIFVIGVLAVLGTTLYAGWRVEQSNQRGFDLVDRTLASNGAAQRQVWQALRDGIEQSRYDHELLVFNTQLDRCMAIMATRPSEYDLLR